MTDFLSSQKDLCVLGKYCLKSCRGPFRLATPKVHPDVLALTLRPFLFRQPKSPAPDIVCGRLSSETNGLTPLSSAV